MSTPTTRNTRRRSDSRRKNAATSRASLTARPPRGSVLQRGGEHAHAEDVLAGVDQLAHDPRGVLAAGAGEDARAGARLHLHAARPGEVRGRARGHHLAVVDDRHAVAHELDLRQQVGVEQHADAALAQPFEQAAHRAAAGGVERAGRLVEEQQPRRADERLGDAEPLLHALGHRPHAAAGHLGELDELQQLAPLLRAARRARQLLMQAEQLVGRAPVGEAEHTARRVGSSRARTWPRSAWRSSARAGPRSAVTRC